MLYPVVTALVAFAGLAPHVAPYPPWGDGLQFIASAQVGGVVHPTGYPLYSLLTMACVRICALFGAGDPAVLGVHLVSALSLAAAAGLLCSVCIAIGERLFPPDPSILPLFPVAGMAAGLALAWGETAFELGTTAEVYTLQLAFQLAILRGAIEIAAPPPRASGTAGRRSAPLSTSQWIALGGLVCGLALAHHRMAAFACLGWGVAVCIYLGRASLSSAPKTRTLFAQIGVGALLGAFGLLCYAYLPVRAAANPPINWGAPDSPSRFTWSVRGGEFTTYRLLSLQPGVPFTAETYKPFAQQRLRRFHRWMGDQVGDLRDAQFRARRVRDFGIVALICLGAGALLLLLPAPGLVVCITGGGYFVLPFLYNIYDIEGYMLAFWAVALIWMATSGALLWRIAERLVVERSMHLFPGILLAIPLVLYRAELPAQRLHSGIGGDTTVSVPLGQSPLTEHWAARLLDSLPEGAIILTEGDNDFFSLHFQQVVRGSRPDVAIVGTNFLKEEWYARYFEGGSSGFHPRTGGGTPQSRGEFFQRRIGPVVRQARAENRRVYFVTHLADHLEEYSQIGTVEMAADLVDDGEAREMNHHLAPPPPRLYELR